MPVINEGTESNGISAHGTKIFRNTVEIAEVKDITLPTLTRKPIDTSTHNSDDDSYVMGIRRKGELQFMVNWLAVDEPTHSADSGLLDAWAEGSKDRYDIEFPDGSNWLFSGFVSNIGVKAPVDGVLDASISIRPSGGQIITP
jgi:hypothetical protein